MSSDSEPEVRTPVQIGLQVEYCGACSMPLEYCEFSPTSQTACKAWRRRHHPELVHGDDALADDVAQLDVSGELKQQAHEVPVSVKKKKNEPEKVPAQILISSLNRKNKIVTIIQNISQVGDEKKVAKALASRFACGASILKGPPPGVYIQGDISDDLPEFLVEKFKMPEAIIFFLDLKKNKKSPAF